MMKGSDIGIQEKKAKLFNEWEKSRHVTIVHQTKDLHTTDYTQLYDFLKYNQKEVDDLKAQRLVRIQDPLAFIATSNNPYIFPVLHQDQPSFNQNYMQQPMPNLNEITDPTTAMNMALALMAKAFKLNYSTSTNNNQRISSNLRNRQIAQPECRESEWNVGNQNWQIVVSRNANQNSNGNGNLVAARAEGNATGHNGNQIRCYNYRGVGHFVRNYTTDNAPVYDSDGSAKYTELLEPIPEPHQVPQNNNNVIFEVFSMEQSGGTVEQHLANDLNKQLSMEKSTVSSLLEEKKKLKSDFKIQEDELLNKQIQLKKQIKELDNIFVKIAKFVRDFKSLAKEVNESLAKHKVLELEIERLLRAIVSQDIMTVMQNNSVVDMSNL
nr:hypothetical protein [Tanacetum cinerariifolium]